MNEARNSSSGITAQYFGLGQTTSGVNGFYTLDQLGSIREVTNSSGAIAYQQSFDPWGASTVLQGTVLPDFNYAGYYFHTRSGLSLTLNRLYSSKFGRWLNRDPIGEEGGLNLFGYVINQPISFIDPSGLRFFNLRAVCNVRKSKPPKPSPPKSTAPRKQPPGPKQPPPSTAPFLGNPPPLFGKPTQPGSQLPPAPGYDPGTGSNPQYVPRFGPGSGSGSGDNDDLQPPGTGIHDRRGGTTGPGNSPYAGPDNNIHAPGGAIIRPTDPLTN